MADQSKQSATVYVAGLDHQVTEQTLHDAFIPFGVIANVTIPRASPKDPHRGFGYVEFELAEDAREAIDNMDQSELFGKVIKVNQAKPQKEAHEGLGSKTALWEQEGYAAKYNVDDQDGAVADDQGGKAEDPMQGLEGLDEAGPQAK